MISVNAEKVYHDSVSLFLEHVLRYEADQMREDLKSVDLDFLELRRLPSA